MPCYKVDGMITQYTKDRIYADSIDKVRKLIKEQYGKRYQIISIKEDKEDIDER